MKRQVLSLLVGVTMTGLCVAQEPEAASAAIKQEITAALENCQKVFEHNFSVPARSQEVNAFIAQQLAKQSPMPVSLSHVILHHKNGTVTVEAKLAGSENLPPEFRGMIEQGASSMIQQGAFGQLLQAFSRDSLRDGVQFLSEKNAYTVLRETDTVLDVQVDDINEQMFDGKTVDSIRLRIDRARKLLDVAKLTFTDGKYIAVKMDYEQIDVPGGKGELYVQKRNTFKHDVFTMPGGKTGLPETFTVEYGKYAFQ